MLSGFDGSTGADLTSDEMPLSVSHVDDAPAAVDVNIPPEDEVQERSAKKSIKCGYCPQMFAYRDSAKRHERIHTGEKPYSCNVCQKRFADRSTLWQHSRLHTGEKPFACKTCGISFRWRKSLLSHLCSQNGDAPNDSQSQLPDVATGVTRAAGMSRFSIHSCAVTLIQQVQINYSRH